jgi:hypothetical protein
MSIKTISILSGAALLALTATASAGPMSVASSQVIAPPTSIEQAHYYRHYGWRHHRAHYGWYGHRHYGYGYGSGYGYGAGYGYGYPGYYHWGYAGAMPAVGMTSEPASGDYCATPEKTCLLYEPGVLATGCSCKVPGGRARGTVTVE